MAAGAWNIYNSAKRYIVNGTIDLDTTTIKMYLLKSTSNASTFTLSTQAALTNRVSGGGFKGAKALTLMSVKQGVSVAQSKWSAAALIFTASGANIGSVKYAVLAVSAGKLICWCQLSTAAFNVTTGNTLTVTENALGIFTIT
jgi:hypothetical protein